MSTREFFVDRWPAERLMFVNVLRALPGDKLDYKPHERNNSAGAIAWLMTEELRSICDLVDKGQIEWAPQPQPNSIDTITAEFEKYSDDLAARMKRVDDEKWKSKAAFTAQGKEIFSSALGEMAWWILFDLIHHRGQLTAYIRPMGGKVPAVYGPSADDQGT